MIEEICIHYEKKELTKNCEYCCGITNLCGLYENKKGTDPFENCFSDRITVEEIRILNKSMKDARW